MSFIDDFKEIWNPTEIVDPPSWEDRVIPAAYTSPSGVRFLFDFEDVKYTRNKKTAAFEFADGNGTYVQDNGSSGRRYPMRMYLWGAEHDIRAKALEAGIFEKGMGKLEHPMYGVKNVVPFGQVTRRDDLKSAANQSIFEVVFWDTIGTIYPVAQDDAAGDIGAAIGEFNDASAEEFSDQISLDSAIEGVTFIDKFLGAVDTFTETMGKITASQTLVNDQMQGASDSLNNGIQMLVGDPLMLALQTQQMIQSPGNMLDASTALLEAYGNLAADLFGLDDATQGGPGVGVGNDSQSSNDFHTKNLYAATYVTGSIKASINSDFAKRSDAIRAAEQVIQQLDDLTVWRDDNYDALAGGDGGNTDAIPTVAAIDTGGGYAALQKAVALTAGFLIQISFSLKPERAIVLDRARTFVDLSAELYGADYENGFDFLIVENDLTGMEILELPRGKRIVYV